jgi:hypothetical protein
MVGDQPEVATLVVWQLELQMLVGRLLPQYALSRHFVLLANVFF